MEESKDAGPDAISEIMRQNRWSMRGFAREVGVSPSTVSRWIKRTRTPSKTMMRKLSERWGVDPSVWI